MLDVTAGFGGRALVYVTPSDAVIDVSPGRADISCELEGGILTVEVPDGSAAGSAAVTLTSVKEGLTSATATVYVNVKSPAVSLSCNTTYISVKSGTKAEQDIDVTVDPPDAQVTCSASGSITLSDGDNSGVHLAASGAGRITVTASKEGWASATRIIEATAPAAAKARELAQINSNSRIDQLLDKYGYSFERATVISRSGVRTAESVVDFWLSGSSGSSLLSDSYEDIGIGYYEQNGNHYWAVVLAVPMETETEPEPEPESEPEPEQTSA